MFRARVMAYRALEIAKYILAVVSEYGDVVTNLKLQKLLFYAQVWHLVKKQAPLFEEDAVAWQFGPVIPEVYDAYKKYGRLPITDETSQADIDVLDAESQRYMDKFLLTYMDYSAISLANMTHNEAPWRDAFEKNSNGGEIIPQDILQQYYSQNRDFPWD
jgi:uncharacterized phage-associated protein